MACAAAAWVRVGVSNFKLTLKIFLIIIINIGLKVIKKNWKCIIN